MSNKKSATPSADEWPLQPDNPARRALGEIGITKLAQLTRYTEKELLALHGVGPKGIRMLREALAGMGLAFSKASSANRGRHSARPNKGKSRTSS